MYLLCFLMLMEILTRLARISHGYSSACATFHSGFRAGRGGSGEIVKDPGRFPAEHIPASDVSLARLKRSTRFWGIGEIDGAWRLFSVD